MKLIYICHLVLCVLFLNLSFAGEHTEIESKNKAIIDTHDEGRRFKLSEKAVKILNLKTEKIVPSQKGSFLIKKDSLVAFGEEFGIFVVQDGWFELVEVKILAKREKGIVISILATPLPAKTKSKLVGSLTKTRSAIIFRWRTSSTAPRILYCSPKVPATHKLFSKPIPRNFLTEYSLHKKSSLLAEAPNP